MADLVTTLHVGHLAVDLVSLSVVLTTFAIAVTVAIRLDRQAVTDDDGGSS